MKMKNKIDLKVIPRTIYTDIVDLPDPVLLGVTIHYYNHSDGTLYMKIFGSGTGWNSNSVELGALTTGTNNYYNLDNFLSRTKPASATTETITLTLKGYSDAGYTTEVYSFSRTVTVIFIKSDDGSWTTDYDNNFDDGTVQDWAQYLGWAADFGVKTDYVLSAPYSLGFASTHTGTLYGSSICLLRDTILLIQLGKYGATDSSWLIPKDKWLRLVVPLPKSSSFTLYLRISYYAGGTYFGCSKNITTSDRDTNYAIINIRIHHSGQIFGRLDDFKIISKN